MKTNPPADAAKLARSISGMVSSHTERESVYKFAHEALAAQASQIETLKADKARLDWLDQVNASTNERNGTRYGWRYDINHNRAALTDHNYPPISVREAIDDARGRRVSPLANTINDDLVREATARATAAEAKAAKMREALERLVNAKALSDVRKTVAGWNGENREDGPYKERHPTRLGATLPKTTCGAVYDLDEAMQAARAALDQEARP